MLRELCQVCASADESGGVLELCCHVPLIVDGFVPLLLQLLHFLLFLIIGISGGALNLILSPLIAHPSEKLALSFRRKS